MFWNKKPRINEDKIVEAFQLVDAEFRVIWNNLHSEYLSDKKILGITALDGLIFFLTYISFAPTKLSKLEDGFDIYERCLIRYVVSLVEQQGLKIESQGGRELFSQNFSIGQMTHMKLMKFQDQYTGNEFLVDILHEQVYKPYNNEFTYPTEFKKAFIEQVDQVLNRAISLINTSLG